jgi:hypothetical protein
MNSSKTLVLMTASIVFLFSACKKEDKAPPPLSATSLNAGRASIRFTSSTNFNGSKSFDVSNTAMTTATNERLGAQTIINLEATEMNDTVAVRKTTISLLVPSLTGESGINIDVSARSGSPLGFIKLESYSIFGIFRTSTSGTITITRLTYAEVEGMIAVVMDDGMKVNGSFAGKFQ